MIVRKNYWMVLMLISFSTIAKERHIETASYLDKLNKHMRLYLNYILGKSTTQERRMVKKMVKKDAAIIGGSVLAVGGTVIAVKVAGPTIIEKIKQLFEKEKWNRQFSSIGKQPVYILTDQADPDKKMIIFIFRDPATQILKQDHNISLEDINTELVNMINNTSNKKTCRVFIPMYKQFDSTTPFNTELLSTNNFLEYYPEPIYWEEEFKVGPKTQKQKFAQGITKWDWTNEFYKNKKNNY